MVTGRELRSANTTETLLYAHVAWHAVGYDNNLAKWLLKSNAFLQKYAFPWDICSELYILQLTDEI